MLLQRESHAWEKQQHWGYRNGAATTSIARVSFLSKDGSQADKSHKRWHLEDIKAGLMVTHCMQHLQFPVQEEQVVFAHEAFGSSHLEEVALCQSAGLKRCSRREGDVEGRAEATSSPLGRMSIASTTYTLRFGLDLQDLELLQPKYS